MGMSAAREGKVFVFESFTKLVEGGLVVLLLRSYDGLSFELYLVLLGIFGSQ